ncbi:hypothetical protein [Actinospica sp.]|uniref:hypothetical protein n=1 Tax=Actinospica sp. TaxID=1872142 RepID=UPI002B8246E6|nr:hypothetical protein [Actinospica sp.]HWG28098.1 hypothetical protein [Actinospica sp.]
MGKGTRAAGTRRAAAAAPPPGRAYGRSPGDGQQSSVPPPPPTRTAARGAAPRPRSGRGATFSVLMMTIAALAAVGVLAAQAEATAPRVRAQGTNASTTKTTSKSGSSSSGTTANALPANSGSGTRVVYSPSQKRVWLVEGSHTVERAMQVVPGTIIAPNGNYTVSAKTPGATGSDNVSVIYVVRFDSGSSTTYGFDADQNITGLPPAPTGRTGGIRMAQLDAQALYEFASVGTTVVVVS